MATTGITTERGASTLGALDLFAGPGGWDLGALSLGIDPLGIEWGASACATRGAAGLRTVQADVAALDPLAYAPCWLMLASPPCQAFSKAGTRAALRAKHAYREAIVALCHGEALDRERMAQACQDERAELVLEPLRWALALRPRYIALEQVPPVLALWEELASALRLHGYQAWTGVLSAERYGVPQTRQRAILLASRAGPVAPPAPTHQRYIPPARRAAQEEGLFAAPEPERIVPAGEEHLEPWVSMAEALGWGMTARPYPVIAGGTGGGPDLEKVGGSQARATIYEEQAAGRWAGIWQGRGQPTKNSNHEDGEWLPDEGLAMRSHNQPRATIRPISEPAPTIAAGHSTASRVWQNGSSAAVRVSLEQALILQTFPADYPVQGSKTAQFVQVGNAVPPALSRAILAALLARR